MLSEVTKAELDPRRPATVALLVLRFAALALRIVPRGVTSFVLFCVWTAYAAPAPTIHIPRIDSPPTLADFEDMHPSARVAEHMVKISGFIAREPSDGARPTQETDVYLAFDQKNLYAVFICWDNEPGKIRARMARREDIISDDSVEIMIDTFHDVRRGYAFFANPFGIQSDALWTEGTITRNQPADLGGFDQHADLGGFDMSFDTVWNSEGHLTSRGYVVLMSIPFKSLRFPSTRQQTWGIILNRSIPRTNENLFWPHISNRIQGRLNQAATLEGLEDIFPSRNMQFNPYGAFRTFRDIDQRDPAHPFFEGRAFKPDVGVDSKFILRDSFVLDATVNPDFGQVESDQPQITVNQRFEVFFPEKRPFFLENSNYFTTPINLVFTRRIGHPEYGLRLTGKSGPWAVAVLASDDRASGERVPPSDSLAGDRAKFFIARVSRDVLDQSTVGAIFTDREFGGGFNRVGGIDANIKLNLNWRVQGQIVTSSTLNPDGSYQVGNGFNATATRSGRKFNLQTDIVGYSPGFVTHTGFVNRTDIAQNKLNTSYFWRPEGKTFISWGPTIQQSNIWSHTGTRLENYFWPGVRFDFTRSTWFNVHPFGYDYSRLRPQDYNGLTYLSAYRNWFWGIEGGTSWFKQIDINWFFDSGGGINFNPAVGRIPVSAQEDQANITVSVHAGGRLRVDNSYLLEHLRERESHRTAVTNHIIRSKWNYQFTKELSARLILQYNSVLSNPQLSSLSPAKGFNADFLITYLVHPGTAIYIGYNSDLQNLDRRLVSTPSGLLTTRDDFLNDSRRFFVKISYLFRP